jgi:prepilin-type N-terminal cleavage/methylation domain-containing protein
MNKRKGFTLIELLVVIAIIAILAAILFPVFAQARAKARQATCLSNIKQIGLAAMMYLQDYDETFPGGPGVAELWYPGPLGSWTNLPTITLGQKAVTNVAGRLVPYIKSADLFKDLDNPTGMDKGATPGRWDVNFSRLSYHWNQGVSQGWSQPTYPAAPLNNPGVPLSLASIRKPAELQLVGDNWTTNHTSGKQGEARWNICFADGHVKFTKYVDAGVPANQRPWTWNLFNPTTNVNVETPCTPTCAIQAPLLQ